MENLPALDSKDEWGLTEEEKNISSFDKKVKLAQEIESKLLDVRQKAVYYVRMTLVEAVRLGNALSDFKDQLPHGSFQVWLEQNFPRSQRSARDYMRLYNQQWRWRSLLSISWARGEP